MFVVCLKIQELNLGLIKKRRVPDGDKWNESVVDKIVSLNKNHTWSLIDRPKTQKAICCKRIFKKKLGIIGVEPPRYKARLWDSHKKKE